MSPAMSTAPSSVVSVVPSMTSRPLSVPVFERVNVSVETIPVVVMLSAPTSIAPNPEVIDPEFRAPTPIIADATASLVSRSAASFPSSLPNSVAEMVSPPTVTSFEPRAIAVSISVSERSSAVRKDAPPPVVVIERAEAMAPALLLSIVKL